MNWLIYIGGGLLFNEIINGVIQKLRRENDRPWNKYYDNMIDITTLAVWIWICWRFI